MSTRSPTDRVDSHRYTQLPAGAPTSLPTTVNVTWIMTSHATPLFYLDLSRYNVLGVSGDAEDLQLEEEDEMASFENDRSRDTLAIAQGIVRKK